MAKAEPPIVGKAPWMAVLPRVEDFKHAMPLNWPAELQARLPEAAAKLLENQRMKHDRDLELVRVKFLPAMQRVFGGVHVDLTKLETLYSHAWLLVNTRCFFWDFETSSPLPKGRKISPGKPRQTPKRRVKDRNDCMALCPVIDCFNHFDKEDVRRALKASFLSPMLPPKYALADVVNTMVVHCQL